MEVITPLVSAKVSNNRQYNEIQKFDSLLTTTCQMTGASTNSTRSKKSIKSSNKTTSTHIPIDQNPPILGNPACSYLQYDLDSDDEEFLESLNKLPQNKTKSTKTKSSSSKISIELPLSDRCLESMMYNLKTSFDSSKLFFLKNLELEILQIFFKNSINIGSEFNLFFTEALQGNVSKTNQQNLNSNLNSNNNHHHNSRKKQRISSLDIIENYHRKFNISNSLLYDLYQLSNSNLESTESHFNSIPFPVMNLILHAIERQHLTENKSETIESSLAKCSERNGANTRLRSRQTLKTDLDSDSELDSKIENKITTTSNSTEYSFLQENDFFNQIDKQNFIESIFDFESILSLLHNIYLSSLTSSSSSSKSKSSSSSSKSQMEVTDKQKQFYKKIYDHFINKQIINSFTQIFEKWLKNLLKLVTLTENNTNYEVFLKSNSILSFKIKIFYEQLQMVKTKILANRRNIQKENVKSLLSEIKVMIKEAKTEKERIRNLQNELDLPENSHLISTTLVSDETPHKKRGRPRKYEKVITTNKQLNFKDNEDEDDEEDEEDEDGDDDGEDDEDNDIEDSNPTHNTYHITKNKSHHKSNSNLVINNTKNNNNNNASHKKESTRQEIISGKENQNSKMNKRKRYEIQDEEYDLKSITTSTANKTTKNVKSHNHDLRAPIKVSNNTVSSPSSTTSCASTYSFTPEYMTRSAVAKSSPFQIGIRSALCSLTNIGNYVYNSLSGRK